MQEFAVGLRFPEGPIALADGSLLVVEIAAGNLTRIDPSGGKTVVAHLGGGPNGAAIGPDGRCYVCNNGGFEWRERDGVLLPAGTAKDYSGGSIQAVDLVTGEVDVLYTHCGEQRLNGPNDIVFDRTGGFWFTDHGHTHGRHRDRGAVYYAQTDGSLITEAVFPVEMPNGIALSPNEQTLYVAETVTGRLWSWSLEAPGRVARRQRNILGGMGQLVYGLGGFQLFDSMAVDAEGNIHVGTVPSGISVVSADGQLIEQIPMPERFATNLCFGGAELDEIFVTLSSTGRVVRAKSRFRGAKLAF
ncbi:SMP-30/gluconolactonase/LRE family protein [Paucibacter sp. R3-3]|uniref:SMP-30/gluconolactonase/LRE family protein n=1 Tax=Roseateles agri TaxID=3098619 RepID=A0ABU5DS27_9BURK|nr:SMP-30/gluconolactonase/LRE family protein [Paucibacter sp. R3-3]MDY0748049.1 SMP-30/gluconolactonase/LRE family protein [Paucibacter sp. R3-3]